MGFDAIAKDAARDMLTNVGQAVTYRGCDGDVTTVGVIEKIVDLLGGDTQISDARYMASLLVEDVGSPQRNDTVTDSAGTEWVLVEEMPTTDKWIAEWSVRSRC